ncbi:MAG: enoyl-CoA hydratase/isomerase family protein [Rhodothermia bacterium]|nr:enoyl-CoA hydratase/isomerase family protein [Rhodothermia bacterium]
MTLIIARERAEGVLELTLNRPDKRNALNQPVVRELTSALEDCRSREDVKAIVLSASGTVFSAGADLESLQSMQTASREENERDSRFLAELFRSVITHPKPIVARIQGHAIAGGCGLAACCDIAIADEAAKFGFTEVQIGFVPALVTSILVNRLRGSDVRYLMLTGALIDASEAERIGLVYRCVPSADLDKTVDEVADRLRQASSQAVALTKQLLFDVAGLSTDKSLSLGADVNVEARQSAECREGIAAFLEKREPSWRRERD